jgi:hypothetical protein
LRSLQIALPLLLAFASLWAFADQVRFKNGDQLTGEILKSDAKDLLINTKVAGQVTVSWPEIQELHSDLKSLQARKCQPCSWDETTKILRGIGWLAKYPHTTQNPSGGDGIEESSLIRSQSWVPQRLQKIASGSWCDRPHAEQTWERPAADARANSKVTIPVGTAMIP